MIMFWDTDMIEIIVSYIFSLTLISVYCKYFRVKDPDIRVSRLVELYGVHSNNSVSKGMSQGPKGDIIIYTILEMLKSIRVFYCRFIQLCHTLSVSP